jgi:predicted MFS family arabinose efflux permease
MIGAGSPILDLFPMTGEDAARSFFKVYRDLERGATTARIGGLLVLSQVVGVSAAVAFPSVARRWGELRAVVISCAGISIALLPLILVSHCAMAALGLAGVSAAGAILHIAPVYSQKLVAGEWRSAISGSLAMTSEFRVAATSLGGGLVRSLYGYRPPASSRCTASAKRVSCCTLPKSGSVASARLSVVSSPSSR